MKRILGFVLLLSMLVCNDIYAYPLHNDVQHMMKQENQIAKAKIQYEKEHPKDLYGNEYDPNNTWGNTTWTGEKLTPEKGIIFANGCYYTYYHQPMGGCFRLHKNKLVPYGIEHTWVSNQGVLYCGPYVCCAAYTPWFPPGTLVDTPFGKGIVVDYNGHCGLPGGTKADIDICTTWGPCIPN